MRKFLYLPIESKVRELDSKLLLSIEAIKDDYIIIIGSKSMMSKLRYLPKGILVYKDSSYPMKDRFQELKELGHKIVVLDEEGFVQTNWDDYLNRRIKFDTINYVDLFLCWGLEQFNTLNGYISDISAKTKLYSTGHPRIDLLRSPISSYNNENKTVNKKCILINTKLGEVNHNKGKNGWINLLKSHNMIKNENELSFRYEQIEYKKALMESYISLLHEISHKFKEYQIVVRPHPVENIDKWRDLTNNLENVIVTNKKPIGYWIHQSDVVIHTGCTTALEAFIMDKPVITFKPIDDKRFEVPLPDSISLKATNEEQCVELIGKLMDNNYDYDTYKKNGNEILCKNIESLEGEFAYEKIVKELDKLEVQPVNFSFILQIKIKSLFLIQKIKSYAKKYLKPTALNENQVFHKNDIELSVHNLQKVIDMQDDIIIDKLSENLYILWKK
ncbi:surface carbohydrate biosynthesis protein [Aliarcobacter skirrowii]|uniref:surface carbohydrate biosynthesis protein n=1 Tax=Aliarcobacter skirrowii TaxID=28200 RepID=UPI0008265512|nr:surface carbohydrate biosynthesis protein [Aliarcobacter skirrowii]